MAFYNEALRRDPGDSRVNTVVGIRYARMGEWALAEAHLLRALARTAKDYTTVKDPEPHYYLGVVYRMQGRNKEATDQFWKATWYPTFQHPAYFALAQIAAKEGDYGKAQELVAQSLYTGARDTKALTLKAWLLRQTGHTREAAETLKEVLSIDPIDYWSLSEQSILAGSGAAFLSKAGDNRGEGIVRLQELLEVATDYGNIGAYGEAIALLDEAIRIGEPYASSPLTWYYNGFFNLQAGNGEAAAALFQKAMQQPSDYCFPFRLEEINIFNAALQTNPSDSKGAFYLGNLLYYLGQKAKGIEAWEKAVSLEPLFARAGRNLGFGYHCDGALPKAIAMYEQSIKGNPSDPRLFFELDQLYEQNGKPAKERLSFMEKNLKTILRHDETVIRLLTLYNETGAYDKGIRILSDRHFHVWEGGGEVHEVYVDAHLLKGLRLLNGKKYAAAIKAFEEADLYPENLEVGRPSDGGHSVKGFYYMGEAYKQMGNREKAKSSFETAAGVRPERRFATLSDNVYFRAEALKELGRTDEADKLIQKLEEEVQSRLNRPDAIDEYAKFGEDGSSNERLSVLHYLNGLVRWYKGDKPAAQTEFRAAIQLNQNLIWPKQFSCDYTK
jgi:tetratricopeptide (TPR) repeat protein